MRAGATLAALAALVAFCALGANGNIFDPHKQFTITQRLRDPGTGHTWMNFSDSVHSLGRWVAVGTISANGYRGMCRMYYDAGDGLKLMATLTDPKGELGDNFGIQVYVFERNTVPHVAVAATNKKSDGAVLVYRRMSSDSDWQWQQTLAPANNDGTYSTNFGRHIFYDGNAVIVSAVSRYKNSKRFEIFSTNIKGTRYFEESSGIGQTDGDPIFTYQAKDGRRNSTTLSLLQVIRGADYTFDFGADVALSTDRQTLAVGSFSRREARFGYGTDGDLIVKNGVKLLDGSAEYNFNNVEIFDGGILTTDLYDSLRGNGGILRMRIAGTLKIHRGGVINMTAHGFDGAPTQYTATARTNGEGPGGGITATSTFTGSKSCNHDNAGIAVLGTGIGAVSETTRNTSSLVAFSEANGGGAGYGSVGQSGTLAQCGVSGAGGPIYGDAELADLQRGSGGGAGHPWKIGSGGAGGAGGGVVWIIARHIINDGLIVNNGGRGSDGGFYSGGGGGGSGGSIYLSGTFFENNGHIYARGGRGGVRSSSSGSEGDPLVRGGDGGVGRIRLEFLTTVTSGIVVPQPRNGTAFDGDVWLYRRTLSTGLYTNYAKMPRVPGMKFIGHSLALHGHMLAVASDDRSFANPVQSVFLVDFTSVQNSSSPIYRYREFHRPDPKDLQFGWRLQLFNDTLLIGSAGENDLIRGIIYLLSSRDLFTTTADIKSFHLPTIAPGDYYGETWHYEYPYLYAQVPLGQDDGFTESNSRLSKGMIQVWQHIRNVSATTSSITCVHTVATANTTVLCTFHARDLHGEPAGDVHDLALITHPPGVIYVRRGKYQFNVTARGSGPMEVWLSHGGRKMPTTSITVTPPIVPFLTNVSCTPLNPRAGDTITCTIQAFNQAGEESAAKDFRVTVYHTDDVILSPEFTAQKTPHGNYRLPPSVSIGENVLRSDFPTVSPDISFVRFGYYSFTYKTWRPGAHAAFIQYQNKPLAFPNPVVIEASEPVVTGGTPSVILCPGIAAPNRTLVCQLELKSADGIPTDRAELAHNFSSVSGSRYLRAVVHKNTLHAASNESLTITAIYAKEGRFSLLLYPTEEGRLKFTGEYLGQTINMNPVEGVKISKRFDMSCVRMSTVLMSFTVMNQHAMGRSDSTVYGNAATSTSYLQGKGMCDNGFV